MPQKKKPHVAKNALPAKKKPVITKIAVLAPHPVLEVVVHDPTFLERVQAWIAQNFS